MNKQTVIDYFGSQNKVAEVLSISRQAVHKWPDTIPEACALRLVRITDDELEYDESFYREVT